MKKGFLITAALAMTLGVGVAVSAHQVSPKAVSATETTSVTIAGSFNDWNTTANPLTLDGDWWTFHREFEADETFKIVVNGSDWVGDGNGVTWCAGMGSEGKGQNFKVLTAGDYLIKAKSNIADYGDKSYGIVFEQYVEPEPDPDAMFSVVIDLGTLPDISGFSKPEVHYFDKAGSTIDKYVELHRLSSVVGAETFYTANLVYASTAQNIDTIQFLFKENSDDKWSNEIALTPTASYVYHFAFLEDWDGGNWLISKDSLNGLPRMRGNGISDTSFSTDVANKNYKVTLELSAAAVEAGSFQIFFGKWNFGALRQTSVSKYAHDYSLNSFYFNEAGKYDIICHNDYSDGGIFEIKKWGSENTYIYYVLENKTPTGDYIYSWGATEQFGSWPGTQITSVVGVQEVSDNAVLHFEDNERLIYKIPVEIGYPSSGDLYFKWNNGKNSDNPEYWASDDSTLVAGAAYWYTAIPNKDAGLAIDFLVSAESIRNATEHYSVCEISKGDATTLVNAYNGLSADVKSYIDSSTVYTYTGTEKDPEKQGMVSYHTVVERLALIAGVSIGSQTELTNAVADSSAIITIVAIVGLIGVSSVIAIIFIRKRRVN